MATRLLFFVAMCVLGGVGGLAGSILVAFAGRWGLFIGGFLGGID